MAEQPWSTARQKKPPVSWDGKSKTFSILLTGLKDIGPGGGIEIEWSPPVTFVVRIRETDSDSWSVGFETPLTGCGFVDLKPNTEYEIEVRSKNVHGESGPVRTRIRTSPEGSLGVGV